jgi:hypothetical protein
LQLRFGTPLSGVVEAPLPPRPSFAAIRNGEFQKAVAARIANAIPLRIPLIRFNNEIRYSLLDTPTVTTIRKYDRNELFEIGYVSVYCSHRDGDADAYAVNRLPRILELQRLVRARGARFLYLITPSKAAHLPDDFVHRIACPNAVFSRGLTTQYARRLREGGVAVLDLATLVHDLKQRYGRDMFPRGGIHWNSLAVAHAGRAVVDALNAETGAETLQPFAFTYHLSNALVPRDHDLEELMNLMIDHIKDQEPRVDFTAAGGCDQHPAHNLAAAIVGGSFVTQLAEVLTEQGCLVQLEHYFYMHTAQFRFLPYRAIKINLTDADFAPLRTVDILLVEENEALVGGTEHFDLLYNTLVHEPGAAATLAAPAH